MPPRQPEHRLILVRNDAVGEEAGPPPFREILLDELLEALVIFDLLQHDLVGESAAPFLWIAPHLERIAEDIGSLVEALEKQAIAPSPEATAEP